MSPDIKCRLATRQPLQGKPSYQVHLERLKSDFFILNLSKKPLPLNVRHSAPIPTLQNFLKCSQQFSALFKPTFAQI